MGLLSFFKRTSGNASARASNVTDAVDSVQQARTRARQRFVGALVLVVAGVVGFPMLFKSQPRPLPGDTPIEIAKKDGPSTLATPTSRAPARSTMTTSPSPTVIVERAADAGREVSPPATPASMPSLAASSAEAPVAKSAEARVAKPAEARAASSLRPAAKPASRPEPKPEPKPEAKPSDAARAQAALDAKGDEAKKVAAPTGDGRFVVQVGAYADSAAAREARQKLEKLGIKTYTQSVETSAGKRIRVRVGPFASRSEAEKVADKIKPSGLTAAVYTL
jgi:DedD protein